MTVVHQIGRRIYPKGQEELAQHARDVQEIFNKVPVVEHRVVETTYTEPMTLSASEEPFCIELVRIANLRAPEIPVSACYGFVHYVWRPQLGGAQITKIGGMDVATNAGTPYRFSYRITYRMVGSHG